MATGTGNLPYPGKSYSPFDILTAEELNEDVANIESLATGVGIGDGAIKAENISNNAIALGYAQITSNFTSTSLVGPADIPGLSVTVNVPTGGRRIKITGYARSVFGSNAGYFYDLQIAEGSTILSLASNSPRVAPAIAIASFVPTAGTHTYKIRHSVGASANVTTEAAVAYPAFILVEMI